MSSKEIKSFKSLSAQAEKDEQRKIRLLLLRSGNSMLNHTEYLLRRSKFGLTLRLVGILTAFVEGYLLNYYMLSEYSHIFSFGILWLVAGERLVNVWAQSIREFLIKARLQQNKLAEIAVIQVSAIGGGLFGFAISIVFFLTYEEIWEPFFITSSLLVYEAIFLLGGIVSGVWAVFPERLASRTDIKFIIALRILPIFTLLCTSNLLGAWAYILSLILGRLSDAIYLNIHIWKRLVVKYSKVIFRISRLELTAILTNFSITQVINNCVIELSSFVFLICAYNSASIKWTQFFNLWLTLQLCLYLSRRVIRTQLPDFIEDLLNGNILRAKRIQQLVKKQIILSSLFSSCIYSLIIIFFDTKIFSLHLYPYFIAIVFLQAIVEGNIQFQIAISAKSANQRSWALVLFLVSMLGMLLAVFLLHTKIELIFLIQIVFLLGIFLINYKSFLIDSEALFLNYPSESINLNRMEWKNNLVKAQKNNLTYCVALILLDKERNMIEMLKDLSNTLKHSECYQTLYTTNLLLYAFPKNLFSDVQSKLLCAGGYVRKFEFLALDDSAEKFVSKVSSFLNTSWQAKSEKKIALELSKINVEKLISSELMSEFSFDRLTLDTYCFKIDAYIKSNFSLSVPLIWSNPNLKIPIKNLKEISREILQALFYRSIHKSAKAGSNTANFAQFSYQNIPIYTYSLKDLNAESRFLFRAFLTTLSLLLEWESLK